MNELALSRLNTLMQLREEVETVTSSGPWEPAADWYASDTHLTLVLDVPGTDPDALAIEEDGEGVTVRGGRSAAEYGEQALLQERPRGVFQRRLPLPLEVVSGSGEASVRAGVLSVRFEKRHKTIDHE